MYGSQEMKKAAICVIKLALVCTALWIVGTGCTTTRKDLYKEKVFYYNGNALSPMERVVFTPDESMMAFFTAYREFTVELKRGNEFETVKYKEPLDFAEVILWTPNTSRIFFQVRVWNKNFAKKYKLVRKVFQGDSPEPRIEVVKETTFADVLEMEVDLIQPKAEGQACRIEVEIIPQEKSAFQKPLKAVAVYAIPPGNVNK